MNGARIVIESSKIIIELDGDQHFKQVWNWNSHNETRKIDVYKMKKSLENSYSVIRLLQTDVYGDKGNWKSELLKTIKKYEEPTIICISNGEEYEKHLSDLNESKKLYYEGVEMEFVDG